VIVEALDRERKNKHWIPSDRERLCTTSQIGSIKKTAIDWQSAGFLGFWD